LLISGIFTCLPRARRVRRPKPIGCMALRASRLQAVTESTARGAA